MSFLAFARRNSRAYVYVAALEFTHHGDETGSVTYLPPPTRASNKRKRKIKETMREAREKQSVGVQTRLVYAGMSTSSKVVIRRALE